MYMYVYINIHIYIYIYNEVYRQWPSGLLCRAVEPSLVTRLPVTVE